MTKKEFMLQVINFLPEWKMGRGLKALIENDQLSVEVFEKLYEIFRQSVHETYSDVQKVEFKNQLQHIEQMRQLEAKHDEQELIDLDAMFDAL